MRRFLIWGWLVLLLAGALNAYSAEPQTGTYRVYTANTGCGTVSVIDAATNALVTRIPVGANPFGVVASADGTKVYVAYQGDDRASSLVAVIDTATNTIINTITVSKGPVEVALTPDGRELYVSNNVDNSISVIDTTDDTTKATIPNVSHPFRIAFSPDGQRAYVSNFGTMDDKNPGNTVTVIDTASRSVVLPPIAVGTEPGWLAVTPDGSKVYVANKMSGTVSVIATATNTVVNTISNVGSAPFGVAITPDGRKVLVSGFRPAGYVYVIDTTTNSALPNHYVVGLHPGDLSNSAYPAGIAIMPDGKTAYVADQGDGSIAVINLTTGAVTILPTIGLCSLDVTIAYVPKPAALGDYVWNDVNGNGVQDADEPGIAGVTINLYTAASTFVATTTTDATGHYLFTTLRAGSYQLEFVKPGGYVFTRQNQSSDDAIDSDVDRANGKTIPITLTPGQTDTTWDAGLVQPATLGDFVWNDLNGNGQQDANEPGIADVTVNLYTTTGAFVATTTTDATGHYQFNGLLPGSYQLEYLAPSGFNFTLLDQGSNNAIDSDVNRTTGKTTPITLSAGQTDLTWDAGLVQPATLGDYVWNDANGNGLQDAGEQGIAKVIVNLYTTTGAFVATTITDTTGYYQFTDLLPGSYQLAFVAPGGFIFTLRDQGSNDAIDSDVNRTTGKTTDITLSAGETDLNWDAGLVQPATLGDFVWNDVNGNGVQDAGEPGITGVTVNLYTTTGTLVASTTTDVTGYYRFTDRLPGSYQLEFIKPSGYIFSLQGQGSNDAIDSNADQATGWTTTIALSAGQTDLTWDAGLVQPAALGDYVWNDANGNGLQDAGEQGIAGVIVNLYTANGAFVGTKTTDATGHYLFFDLLPGCYQLEFIKPSGCTFTKQEQGSNDAIDSDADRTTGTTTTITLSAGQTDLTWDAGLVQPATLGDFVWNDANGNGLQDAGEQGIAGITVNLYTTTGTLVASTTTGDTGYYVFSDLLPGSYQLAFVKPSGYTFTRQDQGSNDAIDSDADRTTGTTTTIALTAGQTDLTWDAGLVQPAALGDYVWNDANGNGLQDAGEAGRDKVIVNLYDASGTVVSTTTTDATGHYQFNGLLPGSYQLEFVAPSGFIFTRQNQDSNDAVDSDVDRKTGKTTPITLSAGQTDLTWDAGLVQPAALGDYVWNDVNGNGLQDADEPGIADVTVNLYTASGTVVSTTTTDATGHYQFTGLLPGSYQLEFLAPSGFNFTLLDQGSNNAIDSDVNRTTGKTTPIALSAGQTDVTWDAGLVQPAALGDYVWNDLNGNGMQDAGEPGIADVTVNLYTTTGAFVATTTTDTTGYYLFTDLLPGSYQLAFVAPGGFIFTLRDQGSNDAIDSDVNRTTGKTIDITLSAGETDLNWDAGLVQPATLGDFVWNDVNGNGVQDAGEPGIAGVTVNLSTATGAFVATTTTNATGYYLFTGLLPDNYQLEFVKPSGYVFSLQSQGSDEAIDSDADRITGKTTTFMLSAGQTDLSWDAGLVQPAALGDYVWNDLNGNGLQNTGEPGIAGVTVNLYTATSTVVATTTTDASGHYLFTGLLPDSYQLEFIAPSGFNFTLLDQGSNDAIDSDADRTTGKTTTIALSAGQTDLTWDTGLVQPATLGKISGFKWNDVNGNGRWDCGELGLANWTIQLLKGGVVIATDTTDANGAYAFTDLPVGAYVVQEVLQTGWLQTAPLNPSTYTVNITGGADIRNLNFGNYAPNMISGHKWHDLNSNGKWDCGEPGLANWTIQLVKDGVVIATTLTDACGYYKFTKLIAGTYTVREVQQTGWTQTAPASPGTYTVSISNGANVANLDFGNCMPCKISGYKWNDLDGDGIWDCSEPALSCWHIQLYKGGVLVAETTTNACGYYEFTGLVAGTYTVQEVQQTGWTQMAPASPGTYTVTLTSGSCKDNRNFGNKKNAGKLNIIKFYDANVNGIEDAGELELAHWKISVKNMATGTTITVYTPASLTLSAGTYRITECIPCTSWRATTPNPVTITLGDSTATVKFGNIYFTGGCGKTIGYWQNCNGQALIGCADLSLLTSLHLRKADGTCFDPTSKTALKSWLGSATATNMAYMLSAQLAAMELNVAHGFIKGSVLVYAPGTKSANAVGYASINALMAEADAELALHGLTKTGSAYRAYQEVLKNVLDNANNGSIMFVQSTPGPYSF